MRFIGSRSWTALRKVTYPYHSEEVASELLNLLRPCSASRTSDESEAKTLPICHGSSRPLIVHNASVSRRSVIPFYSYCNSLAGMADIKMPPLDPASIPTCELTVTDECAGMVDCVPNSELVSVSFFSEVVLMRLETFLWDHLIGVAL